MSGPHKLPPHAIPSTGAGCKNGGCKNVNLPTLPAGARDKEWQLSKFRGGKGFDTVSTRKLLCGVDKWPHCGTNVFQTLYPNTTLGDDFATLMQVYQGQFDDGTLCTYNSINCNEEESCDAKGATVLFGPGGALVMLIATNALLEGVVTGPSKMLISVGAATFGYTLGTAAVDTGDLQKEYLELAAKAAGATVGAIAGGFAADLAKGDVMIETGITGGAAAVGFFLLTPILRPFITDVGGGVIGGIIGFANKLLKGVEDGWCKAVHAVKSGRCTNRYTIENIGGWAARMVHQMPTLEGQEEKSAAFNCLMSNQLQALSGAGGEISQNISLWEGNSQYQINCDGPVAMIADARIDASRKKFVKTNPKFGGAAGLGDPFMICKAKAKADPKARWGLVNADSGFRSLTTGKTLMTTLYNIGNLKTAACAADSVGPQWITTAFSAAAKSMLAISLTYSDNCQPLNPKLTVLQSPADVFGLGGTFYTTFTKLGDMYRASLIMQGGMPDELSVQNDTKTWALQSTLKSWWNTADSNTRMMVTQMQDDAAAKKTTAWNTGGPYDPNTLNYAYHVNQISSSIAGRSSGAEKFLTQKNMPTIDVLTQNTLELWRFMASSQRTAKIETYAILEGMKDANLRKAMAKQYIVAWGTRPAIEQPDAFAKDYANACGSPASMCVDMIATWKKYADGTLPAKPVPAYNHRMYQNYGGLQKAINVRG